MTALARVSLMVASLVASAGLWTAPSAAASFADLPPDREEVSLLNERLQVKVPKGVKPEPPPFGLMSAPAPPEQQLRLVIDSGPLRLVVMVSELFRVSPGSLTEHGPVFLKFLAEDRRVGPLSVAPSAATIDGLEILEYEPRGQARFGDANLIKGALTKHPDGATQSLNFFVNDPALADLPAARRLIADMVGSLKPGPRPLPTGMRVQPPGGGLVLDLLPGYTAYRQVGPDFDVYWVERLVPLGQAAGRLGIYSGHHPQPGGHPDNARMERAVLFGRETAWYMWEGRSDKANVSLFFQEAFVVEPGPPTHPRDMLTRHIFLHAFTQAESADFQRIAESAAIVP
jgi:hypothetical protein